MTPAQRRTLARLALRVPRPQNLTAQADKRALDALAGWVEAYAERPRAPVIPSAPVSLVPTPAGVPSAPPRRPWWQRLWRRA